MKLAKRPKRESRPKSGCDGVGGLEGEEEMVRMWFSGGCWFEEW